MIGNTGGKVATMFLLLPKSKCPYPTDNRMIREDTNTPPLHPVDGIDAEKNMFSDGMLSIFSHNRIYYMKRQKRCHYFVAVWHKVFWFSYLPEHSKMQRTATKQCCVRAQRFDLSQKSALKKDKSYEIFGVGSETS